MHFIMLTRLVGKEVHPEKLSLKDLGKKVEEKIKKTCPSVVWLANYATLGPYDYLDIFDAPDLETAMKVAVIVRSFGHASTEIWSAVEWREFKEIIASVPA